MKNVSAEFVFVFLILVEDQDTSMFKSSGKKINVWVRLIGKSLRIFNSYLIYDFSLVYMEASEPKWVNPLSNIIGVNSLRLGGLHICLSYWIIKKKIFGYSFAIKTKSDNSDETDSTKLVIYQNNLISLKLKTWNKKWKLINFKIFCYKFKVLKSRYW